MIVGREDPVELKQKIRASVKSILLLIHPVGVKVFTLDMGMLCTLCFDWGNHGEEIPSVVKD